MNLHKFTALPLDHAARWFWVQITKSLIEQVNEVVIAFNPLHAWSMLQH